jgi:hypothetical protein
LQQTPKSFGGYRVARTKFRAGVSTTLKSEHVLTAHCFDNKVNLLVAVLVSVVSIPLCSCGTFRS